MSTIIGHGALDATTATKAAGTYAGAGGLGDRGNVAGAAGRGNLAGAVTTDVVWFTVLGEFEATDENALTPINALVTFRPRLARGQQVFVSNLAGIAVRPLTARIYNGVLTTVDPGTPGFALIANSAQLNVGGDLVYDVSFMPLSGHQRYRDAPATQRH